MDSDRIEHLARTAYEAYRETVSEVSPVNGPWEQVSDAHKSTWRRVATAVVQVEGDSGDAGGQ